MSVIQLREVYSSSLDGIKSLLCAKHQKVRISFLNSLELIDGRQKKLRSCMSQNYYVQYVTVNLTKLQVWNVGTTYARTATTNISKIKLIKALTV